MSTEKYNIGKFNIKNNGSEDVVFSMYCDERLELITRIAANIPVNMTAVESLHTRTKIAVGVNFSMDLVENIEMDITGDIAIYVLFDAKENLQVDVIMAKNISIEEEYMEDLKLKAYVGKDINYSVLFSEDIKFKDMLGSLNLDMPYVLLDEQLFVNVNATFIDELVTKIDIALKKGDVLRIDSGDMTVYLNSENVFDKYNQEWINVSRQLEHLDISSAIKGELKGKIIFREYFI